MSSAPVPVNEPLLDGNEKAYLAECIDTGWISSDGPFVKRFEETFAARCGRRHAIAVSNGSVALDLALHALQLQPGDEVILPTFTIISCLTAVLRAGAVPVFVDADPATWNARPDEIEARITPRTRAIMVVHLYGLPTDMDPVLELARRHGLRVIEDAAEAHGLDYRGRPCGSFGDISTFSFYANKHVTTGEGGMVLTDDDALAERCRNARNLYFRPERRFVHEELGWNYRLTNLQAAVGLAQVERLDAFIARKRAMGRRYDELLGGVPGLRLPLPRTDYAENSYWVYGVVIEGYDELDAATVMTALQKRGIGTRPFFWPLHEQPALAPEHRASHPMPVAENLARRGFYLPSGLALTTEQMERSAHALAEVLHEHVR